MHPAPHPGIGPKPPVAKTAASHQELVGSFPSLVKLSGRTRRAWSVQRAPHGHRHIRKQFQGAPARRSPTGSPELDCVCRLTAGVCLCECLGRGGSSQTNEKPCGPLTSQPHLFCRENKPRKAGEELDSGDSAGGRGRHLLSGRLTDSWGDSPQGNRTKQPDTG